MGLIQIWRMLWARRALILIGVVIGAVLAVMVAKMIPTVYEAKTRIVLNFVRPDPVTGEVISTGAAKTYVQTQTELMRDYRVTGEVVDAFGWAKLPELQRAYAARSDRDPIDIRQWLARGVSASSSAALVENSNILEISYKSTSPETARKAADALRDAYIDQLVAAKRESAARNARWFHRQAETLKRNLAAAEARKAAFEKANGIILQDDNVDTESARLKALASVAPTPAAVAPMIVAGASPTAGQLAVLDAQIATARATLGPNHPEMLALQRQRAAVAAAAGREAAAARAAAGSGVGGASTVNLIDAQTRKVLAQRGLVGEAQRLAGEVTVLRDQLGKTAQRAAEFELQAQSNESGLDPLGNAALPEAPTSPGLILFLLGGLLVGAGVGAAVALLLELLFRRVRGVEDLTIEGVPVLAAMPRSNRGEERKGLLYWLGLQRTTERAAA